MRLQSHVHAGLVVDDDGPLREALIFYLQSVGFTVRGAEGAKAALSLLQNGFRPCAILVDVQMPQGGGWTLAECVQADPSLADIPVIMISGAAIDAPRAARLGVRKFLPKPVEPEAIAEAVAAHCKGSS
jgi:CheY-like chemotaxis protein